MKEIDKLTEIYFNCKNQFNNLPVDIPYIEKNILDIINQLTFNKTFKFLNNEEYLLNEISALLRFYEKTLHSSFSVNKTLFEIQFKCYILVIRLFTELCRFFSTHKNKRHKIEIFFQLLKESKTMLKFMLPLDKKHITIINNIIGEHLYYFSHIQYIDIENKNINYILEEYFLYCERMLHGYELSLTSNFGDNELTNKDIEYAIFINNLSFLLLKMIHNINYSKKEIIFCENNNLINILMFYKKVSLFHKNISFEDINSFENSLIKEFKESANYLLKSNSHDMFKEKIDLLQLDTDEYKQLIDIIINSKI
jgi:hypothetical protein